MSNQEVLNTIRTTNEKVQLISQFEAEDKHAVYRIIDGMLKQDNEFLDGFIFKSSVHQQLAV